MLLSTTLFLAHITTYWLSCLMFSLISEYLHNNNKIYYIEAEKRLANTPPWSKIRNAIIVSLVNQLISFPIIYTLSQYCINTEITMANYPYQFAIYTIIADQWFYWTHRTMHRVKYFYNNIHYIHHQWTYPIAVRTIYAHPIEHIITNIGSIVLPPLIYPTSVNFLIFWVSLATFNAVVGHSGIRFPIFANEKHDLHHRFLNCNYGTFGLSDRLFGTRRF